MIDSPVLESNFSEKDYLNVEAVYFDDNNYRNGIIQYFQRHVEPDLKKRGSFLDIGSGLGDITDSLAVFFSSTTVVEPNREFAAVCAAKGYVTHAETFQTAVLEKSYDFIFCAHSLYYVKQDEWPSILKKMYDSLNPGGRALILIMADRGPLYALCRSLDPHCINHSRRVGEVLQDLHIPFVSTIERSGCKMTDPDAFLQLVRLFSLDNTFLSSQFNAFPDEKKEAIYSKIDAFVKTCKMADQSYELIEDHGYLLMKKNAS